ncbi:hypothetical protein RF679_18505 [Undibacterium cyanobacteriorum]|uniref:VCBS repeat-containing protein n=1 Tax=Undibacterium cyanobacteriorum TaxID=3073561 RepID=A0ABY9RID8_9BURK|nr:hypothetical protein [Undibacterium sp. 20NA77.5]WMW80608.1 hypothetical protein RF679_18505 [Undibacterium sp. 20NA77.5]
MSFAIALFLSSALSSTHAQDLPLARIYTIGQHHGDEAPAKFDQGWLGLIVKNGKAELKSVRPQVKTVYDQVLDDINNKQSYSGREISVKGDAPLLLIQMNSLTPGKVEMATIEQIENSATLTFHQQDYVLDHECVKQKAGTKLTPCKIILQQGSNKQAIEENFLYPDGNFTKSVQVVWAGDLDRDGKLDLILRTNGDNNSILMVYLSSMAKGRHMLKKVASYEIIGC